MADDSYDELTGEASSTVNQTGGLSLWGPPRLFRCPKGHEDHGTVSIHVGRRDIDGNYCLICYSEWLAVHLSRVETVE